MKSDIQSGRKTVSRMQEPRSRPPDNRAIVPGRISIAFPWGDLPGTLMLIGGQEGESLGRPLFILFFHISGCRQNAGAHNQKRADYNIYCNRFMEEQEACYDTRYGFKRTQN